MSMYPEHTTIKSNRLNGNVPFLFATKLTDDEERNCLQSTFNYETNAFKVLRLGLIKGKRMSGKRRKNRCQSYSVSIEMHRHRYWVLVSVCSGCVYVKGFWWEKWLKHHCINANATLSGENLLKPLDIRSTHKHPKPSISHTNISFFRHNYPTVRCICIPKIWFAESLVDDLTLLKVKISRIIASTSFACTALWFHWCFKFFFFFDT